ncbi:amino acid adenylation domain-containing protein [Massilia sp. erpn]|uniref:amino acid adenylation domain-containing protein n=1 Tax=Massilia sp. erpn TaxID=2738142 RepID=UPI0021059364|nr:amino acid adenylation domain-containing protein [Massilia sp. erpn]UTY57075.1 amino acid adenylation domain-containing protein [Massilia sp. erpn]
MDAQEKDRFPASFSQRQLWFLEQFEPGSARYNVPAIWRLRGALDIDALERSLNEIVHRHEILRTTFTDGAEGAMQLISATLSITLDVADLCGQDEAWHEGLELARAYGQTPFDLANGPLLRAGLVQLAADDHLFILVLHHIVTDGWSMEVLIRELSALYCAEREGQPATLKALPIQYADYSAWQNDWMTGEVLEEHLAYWRSRLHNAAPALDLPTARRAMGAQGQRAAYIPFNLEPEICAALEQLSKQAQTTLFSTLATALGTVLFRYSGQADLCIGYPVACRNYPEIQDLIGFFVNTLVLRMQMEPHQSFASLQKQVAKSVLDANDFQELPFSKLVEDLRPGRAVQRSPIFQVLFSYYSSSSTAAGCGLSLSGIQADIVPCDSEVAKFDLTLELVMRDGRIVGVMEYNADLFDPAMVAQIMDSYRCVLEAVVAAPATLLRDLPLQAPDQARRLLADFNQHAAGALETRCLHQLFELQVERTPSATALLFGEQALSYAELNLRANRLAHALRADGVGPDTLVGLCVERGCDMVVGMLAILKAGGAYVPLDPDYPAERLAYMLDDTRAPVLLLQRHLAARLPSHAARVHWLDEAGTAPGQPDGNPPNRTLPQHLAYCIYTSGSTGGPKGAINTHQGVANLLAWYCPGQAGGERIMLASSLSFDLTQKNILGPLLAGATLVIPCGGAADVAAFQDALQRHRPSRINCAPSAYRAYMEAAQPHSLRTVVLGGEPIDQALAAALAAQGIALVNSYGPTECADVALFHHQEPDATAGPLPLGRPLPHVRVYVLDAALVPVPPGVAGEIHIAGSGLARGYLNRPGLSADRFIPDPYGPPGSRMYRTGDLGRHTSAGTIEFIGRLDHQVKIRGHRIELGEIEQALLRCQDVREAVITAPADPAGERRLVAYVSVQPTAKSLTGTQLQSQLFEVLPAYMVPTCWVILDKLPLNGNGKVDRAALPAPDTRERLASHAANEPMTPLESQVAQLWQELLACKHVGLDDNFFELGGHSLLVTDLLLRVRKQCGVVLSTKSIYIAQDLQSFCGLINQRSKQLA